MFLHLCTPKSRTWTFGDSNPSAHCHSAAYSASTYSATGNWQGFLDPFGRAYSSRRPPATLFTACLPTACALSRTCYNQGSARCLSEQALPNRSRWNRTTLTVIQPFLRPVDPHRHPYLQISQCHYYPPPPLWEAIHKPLYSVMRHIPKGASYLSKPDRGLSVSHSNGVQDQQEEDSFRSAVYHDSVRFGSGAPTPGFLATGRDTARQTSG